MPQLLLRSGHPVLVDDEDVELVLAHSWTAHAATWGGRTFWRILASLPAPERKSRWISVSLHRRILDAPPGSVVDHVNHDTLDNRRSNLRLCTYTGNNRNRRKGARGSSRFKGVFFLLAKGRWPTWMAMIQPAGARREKSFKTEREAAMAYDAWARELYGEFACLNFPGPGERSAFEDLEFAGHDRHASRDDS